MKANTAYSLSVSALIAVFLSTLIPVRVHAAVTRQIVFPVLGATSYSDDFGNARSGHTHQGNDIFGQKGQPLIAAADGTVEWVTTPAKNTQLQFSIRDDDGYSYWYLHENNDAPGTDDGSSRGIFAYAPDVYRGNRVVAGQLVGWLGDSGNAETTRPHLHFELHPPGSDAVSPFKTLKAARHITQAVIPPALENEFLPFGQFSGGASVALGDVDPQTTGREIVTGAGPGGGPQVRVMATDGRVLAQFFAFEKTFKGGIDVTTGDVDGDGVEEIIVGSGRGRSTEVRVFSMQGQQRATFVPYTIGFQAGVHVAAADLNGDGRADMVTGPLHGGGPHVRVFDGVDLHRLDQFFAYSESFRGGIDVAAYPATPERPPLIVTTALHGGGPNVRVYDARDHSLVNWFFAGDQKNHNGLRVAMSDIDTSTTDPEIVVIAEIAGAPTATVYDLTGAVLSAPTFLEPWWEGGYDVAAEPGDVLGVTAMPAQTRRRTTVRWLVDRSY
ncbi:MAG: peptidoglycan DD-metalloendopeptidase family protein [Ilumatobacteraceae bacterium]